MRDIIVKSAKPLDDNAVKKIKDTAKKKYGNDYTVKFILESELLGGLIIYDDGVVIDNSVVRKLNNIKKIIKQDL